MTGKGMGGGRGLGKAGRPIALLALLLQLGACERLFPLEQPAPAPATGEQAGREAQPPPPAPPRKPPVPAATAAPEQPPQAPTEVAKTEEGPPQPQPDPKGLIGLDQPQIEALLGAPEERAEAAPARIWRYAGTNCELDIYFYLDLKSQVMRALHFEVKSHDPTEPTRDRCYADLVARHEAGISPAGANPPR